MTRTMIQTKTRHKNNSTFEQSNLCGWLSEAFTVLFIYFYLLGSLSPRELTGATIRLGGRHRTSEQPLATVTLGSSGDVKLDGRRLSLAELEARLLERKSRRPASGAYVRVVGGSGTDYVWALRVRERLQAQGISAKEVLPSKGNV